MVDGISVIMPTYNQAMFIRRAIHSIFNQTFENWELIIINDGCTDETESFLRDFIKDERIRCIKNENNEGLGYSINQGLDNAKYNYIAYLPSDDYFYEEHLESIIQTIIAYKDCNPILIYSGMKYGLPDTVTYYSDTESFGKRRDYSLQLVQTVHRKTEDRWIERTDWVTEDLYDMFWGKLLGKGAYIPTNAITCFWTSHPHQRHKILGEKYGGGINYYRSYYNIKSPIKMRTSAYKFINEEELYVTFRKPIKQIENALKVLIVGELAYNSERIYALEEAGCKLYGLWLQHPPHTFNTVGPLPFGHVEDIPFDNWQEKIKEIKPNIIYALLNYSAISLAYDVLRCFPNIPFVWHFKEGPTVSLEQGIWNKLIYLYSFADGKIYLNKLVQQWYEQFIPQNGLSYILDGDLPKKDYYYNSFSNKLSAIDGEIHTVIAGRVIGLNTTQMEYLVSKKIHIHIYLNNYHDSRRGQMSDYKAISSSHIHIHQHCSHNEWVAEFSQYDAGWLHSIESCNNGVLLNASWDDLNIPARISTYAAAGIPVILKDNSDHLVAVQTVVKDMKIGLFYKDSEDLVFQLKDTSMMKDLQNNMMKNRDQFCFDNHVPNLISFFKRVIKNKQQQ